MFKKIYEKLFAKALQAEREAHTAELRAVKEENIELNSMLVAATKQQIALMNEINELKNQLAVNENKTHVAAITAENERLKEQYFAAEEAQTKLMQEINELEDKHADAQWRLTMANEKIEVMKASASDAGQERFAASKAIAFFTVLAQTPTDGLRNMHSNFTVKHEAGKWLVVTGTCCGCGCDLTKEFPYERTALLYALLRTSFEQKPNEALCSTCGND